MVFLYVKYEKTLLPLVHIVNGDNPLNSGELIMYHPQQKIVLKMLDMNVNEM